MRVMNRLLLALALSLVTSGALANHLLHDVPADVGADIEKECKELWASSAFTEGWCVDQRVVEWIRKHPDASKVPPPDRHYLGSRVYSSSPVKVLEGFTQFFTRMQASM